ncbi:hypothetical protein U9M48_007208 [Paspalum notatum var. saurae]|uniref:Uncharacterized protein n=1 Tax=Paspalum notatum var. saurae TaxID=547442 RepID=A0AAQ3SMG0_PASNO
MIAGEGDKEQGTQCGEGSTSDGGHMREEGVGPWGWLGLGTYLKESALILMCIAFLTILTRTHSDDLIHSRQELVSAMASGVLAGRRRGVGQPQFPSSRGGDPLVLVLTVVGGLLAVVHPCSNLHRINMTEYKNKARYLGATASASSSCCDFSMAPDAACVVLQIKMAAGVHAEVEDIRPRRPPTQKWIYPFARTVVPACCWFPRARLRGGLPVVVFTAASSAVLDQGVSRFQHAEAVGPIGASGSLNIRRESTRPRLQTPPVPILDTRQPCCFGAQSGFPRVQYGVFTGFSQWIQSTSIQIFILMVKAFMEVAEQIRMFGSTSGVSRSWWSDLTL